MLNIYVTTCDSYDRLLKPFSYLFNKFWDDSIKVTILGYRTPPFELPKNFNFISIGERQISVNHWSTDLYNFFNTIDDEFFIFAVEDLFICDYVDTDILNKLIDNIDKETGRIALVNTFQNNCSYEITNKYDNFSIGTASQGSDCRFSVIWSIFNREWFLKYVKPNETGTPWVTEAEGDNDSKFDTYDVKGPISRSAIKCTSAVRKNINSTLGFKIMDEDESLDERIIEDMINKKLISKDRTII
tara:strand:+ start:485 stop:1216 length:732 start_codon:yes stop_codon:yes gene_type:complete